MVQRNLLNGKIVSAGLTASEVAKRMNISRTTFSRKINGRGCFDTEEVMELCDILGINSDTEKCEIFLAKSSQ